MMKFALFAALALLPFLAFAGDNRCETCGKDLFPAKYSRQCAACIVRESVTEFSDFVRYTDKDMPGSRPNAGSAGSAALPSGPSPVTITGSRSNSSMGKANPIIWITG